MKKMMNFVKSAAVGVGGKAYSKLQRFYKEERGDAVGWVMGIFITVLLLIGLYILFKEQLDTFVRNLIFGKMNSLS